MCVYVRVYMCVYICGCFNVLDRYVYICVFKMIGMCVYIYSCVYWGVYLCVYVYGYSRDVCVCICTVWPWIGLRTGWWRECVPGWSLCVCTHACACARTQAQVRANTHAQTHTHTHAYMRTTTHTDRSALCCTRASCGRVQHLPLHAVLKPEVLNQLEALCDVVDCHNHALPARLQCHLLE